MRYATSTRSRRRPTHEPVTSTRLRRLVGVHNGRVPDVVVRQRDGEPEPGRVEVGVPACQPLVIRRMCSCRLVPAVMSESCPGPMCWGRLVAVLMSEAYPGPMYRGRSVRALAARRGRTDWG
jgi:hypothetical protein